MPGFAYNALEAITREKGVRPIDLPYLSGHTNKTCQQAICLLYKYELIERHAMHHYATEKGKIVLAIRRGKDRRQTVLRKSA